MTDDLKHDFIDSDDNAQALENSLAVLDGRNAFDYVDIRIRNPSEGPLVHEDPKYKEAGEMPLERLVTYDKRGTDWSERLINPHAMVQGERVPLEIDPLKRVVELYKEQHFGTNQATLQVSMPCDNVFGQQRPNLALIDTRVRYGKLHLFGYLTSCDLVEEFPQITAGFTKLLNKWSTEMGIEPGELFFTSPNMYVSGDAPFKPEAKEPSSKFNMQMSTIDQRTLPELWFYANRNCLFEGLRYNITGGSYAPGDGQEGDTRTEYDYFSGRCSHPQTKPMVPDVPQGMPPPTSRDYIEGYQSYLGFAHDPTFPEGEFKKPKEDYTYGERMRKPYLRKHKTSEELAAISTFEYEKAMGMDQYMEMITAFQNGAQNFVWDIGMANDLFLKDPPCLRLMYFDMKGGKMNMHVYFRSWDCYAGLPGNLGGFEIMHQKNVVNEMAEMFDKDPAEFHGQMFIASKGLHIYGKYKEFALETNYFKQDVPPRAEEIFEKPEE